MDRRRFLLISSAAVANGPATVLRPPPRGSGAERRGASEAPAADRRGLQLVEAGTERAYFAYRGRPLLSFGGPSDHIFYGAEDAYDYRRWCDWAVEHGMNHVRAYPPQSFSFIEGFARRNGGSTDDLLFPYRETGPGSRKFDLTRFDPRYWKRFRRKCEYLQAKGIILHLLMWTGWLTAWDGGRHRKANERWGGHFFNPQNNVNRFTNHLRDHPERIYSSVADGVTGLVDVQKAWYRKLIAETHDLDNVYYDLIHEIFAGSGFESWPKAQRFVDEMAATVRGTWAALEPKRPIILGMDAGGLQGVSPTNREAGNRLRMPREGSQVDWVYTRPYFNLAIWGWAHGVENARRWRMKYCKPYIPQESFDDNGRKYTYRDPAQRVHIRKYMWKFMMAKCQQLDLYVKVIPGAADLPGPTHNYNPHGWNEFEDDALVLRAFWNRLQDYARLWFVGEVRSGPGSHRYVLSSSQEALAYCSSATGTQNKRYPPSKLVLRGLAARDGPYTAEIVKPAVGVVHRRTVEVARGRAAVDLPAFVDDMAVHLYRRRRGRAEAAKSHGRSGAASRGSSA